MRRKLDLISEEDFETQTAARKKKKGQ